MLVHIEPDETRGGLRFYRHFGTLLSDELVILTGKAGRV
jgi:hypothetical protein